jgi:hypothetical protein
MMGEEQAEIMENDKEVLLGSIECRNARKCT